MGTRAGSTRATSEPARSSFPDPRPYVWESDYFERKLAARILAAHYPRLRATNSRYDPSGPFFVYDGLGSDDWSRTG